MNRDTGSAAQAPAPPSVGRYERGIREASILRTNELNGIKIINDNDAKRFERRNVDDVENRVKENNKYNQISEVERDIKVKQVTNENKGKEGVRIRDVKINLTREGYVPTIKIETRHLRDVSILMIDSGSSPNLVKERMLAEDVSIDRNEVLRLTGSKQHKVPKESSPEEPNDLIPQRLLEPQAHSSENIPGLSYQNTEQTTQNETTQALYPALKI
ncbi:hypothetical protein KPH14_002457 [Odynerus spinipes]|uniref:Uncharacterized protein n=1 Tax=Odynerus spinipes TaxID=1348599 RepID=A0AAD9RFZ0_9HYME|nr:hypothetical protein KPH14_002457 [Odynerus spinipes]